MSFAVHLMFADNPHPLWHADRELILILTGRCTLRIGSRDYTANAGSVWMINRFEPHYVIANTGDPNADDNIEASYICLSLPAESLHDIRSDLASRRWHACLVPDVAFEASGRAIVSRAMLSIVSGDEALITPELCALAQWLSQIGADDDPPIASDDRFREVLEDIREHSGENVSLTSLADRHGFSVPYLSRSLHRLLGMTFREFLSELRVQQSLSLLDDPAYTIADIAARVGFPNVNALIKAFRGIMGTTPGAYQRQSGIRHEEVGALPHQDSASRLMDYSPCLPTDEQLEALRRFALSDGSSSIATPEHRAIRHTAPIRINAQAAGEPVSSAWNQLINIAYIDDLINPAVQQQLRELRQDLGFSMLRCHGVFDDTMQTFQRDDQGRPRYYFDKIDQAYDFLISQGITPYIELGYLPGRMLSDNIKNRDDIILEPYANGSIIAMPDSLEEWSALVGAFARHLINRYGMNAVRSWIFSPWGPEVGYLTHAYTPDQFLALYKTTWKAIKNVDTRLTVAGPCTHMQSWELNRSFLIFCRKHSCIPDILAFAFYHFMDSPTEADVALLQHRPDTLNGIISPDPSQLTHVIDRFQRFIAEQDIDCPLYIQEWNLSSWQRDPRNDTCYKSTFLIKNMLEAASHCNALGYMFALDRVTRDELAPLSQEFHGGFGLLTAHGIRKASYQAMWLMSLASGRNIHASDGCHVFRDDHTITVFRYNYVHYDRDYRYQILPDDYERHPYRIQEQQPLIDIPLELESLTPGRYRIERFGVCRDGGSAYDQWTHMGRPSLDDNLIFTILQGASSPMYHSYILDVNGILTLPSILEPWQLEVIRISECTASDDHT